MSIRVKLILIFLVIALVPMLLLEILIFKKYEQSLEVSQIQHLQDVLAFKANKLETYFLGLKNNIEITSNTYFVRKYFSVLRESINESNNQKYISTKEIINDQISEIHRVLPDLSDIMLVDPNGKIIFALRPSHYKYNVSKLNEAQKKSLIGGREGIFFSDVYYDGYFDHRYEILVTAPINDFNNVFTGIVVFEIDMNSIYKIIEEKTALGKTGEAVVGKKIDSEFVFLSPLKYEKNVILVKKIKIGDKLSIAAQNAVQGKTGAGVTIDYRGKQVIAAWKYLPTLGWGMAVKIDTSEAFESVIILRKAGVITLLFIFLLAGVAAIYISNTITNPLKELTKGAQIIGSGNLDYKVSVTQRDEIGQLSRMFDKMTSDLKLTTASRDDLNREIDERTRTAEILKRSEAKYRELVQNASSVILRLDKEGNTTFFNEFAEKFFGYCADEIIGKSINLIVPQQESTGRDLTGMIEDIINNPDKYSSNMNENICKDGRRVWMNWSNRPIFDEKGQLKEILCVGTDITELKNAEDRLRESEQRYRKLFENMLDGYSYGQMIYDDKGQPIDFIHIDVNTSFTKQTGLENVIDKRITEVAPGIREANPEFLEILGRISRNGEPERFVLEIKPLKMWFTIAAYCTKPGYVVMIFENITERKRAEDALRLSEERLQFALESCHIGAWEIDLADRTTYRSIEHGRIFGYSPPLPKWSLEMLIKHVLPEYRADVEELVRNGTINKTGWSYECRIRRLDGEIRWIWFSGQYYKNIFGRERVAGVVQDITERKRAEESLRLEQDRLELALDSANMGVWRAEITENKNYGDDRTLHMLGTSKEEYACTNDAFFSLIHTDYREKVKTAYAQAIENNYPYEVEFAVIWPDGNLHYLNARGKLERNKKGLAIRMHGIIWDISERKKREEDLARLNRVLRALSDANQAMVHAEDEMSFMQEICGIVDKDCGYAMVFIAFKMNDNAKTIKIIAYSGLEEKFVEELKLSWDEKSWHSKGPTGKAVLTGKVNICKDMMIDPDFEAQRELTLKRGYRSALAVPLIEGDKVFGAMTVTAKIPDAFSQEESNLLAELGNRLSYGISFIRVKAARAKAEKELRESLTHLEIATEAGTIGTWEHDLSNDVLVWDDRCKRIFGVSADTKPTFEMLLNLLHPEDRPIFVEETRGSMSKCKEYEGEFRIWREGEIRWVYAKGHGLGCPDKCERMTGVVIDVSERKKREAELARLNRMYKALSDSNQAMMNAEDETKFMEELCKIIKEDCGYPTVTISYAENDESKTIHPIAYIGVDKVFLENLKISWGENKYGTGATGRAIRTGNFIVCGNIITDPSYETWRKEILESGYASTIALPLMENNKAFGAITIFSKEADGFSKDDISLLVELSNNLAYGTTLLRARIQRDKDRAKLEQLSVELKRSNSELENFANIVSHDLREPLRAITGFMELLQIKYKDKLDEKANGFIDLALSGGRSMRNMLLGLLEYSRVQTEGKKFSKVDTNEIVKNVINNLSVKITETETEITHCRLPIVKGDEPQLTQLIQNLIQNAIKFRSEKKPKIHIGCRKQKNGYLFSVRDNGIGIDKQYHESIFMIFQRVHAKEDYEGTGVGLSVCRRIVERHKGQIWVESELGKGATFYFTIPD
jgi:PAS domain S-box-containing protein